jgi:hypothetical protein
MKKLALFALIGIFSLAVSAQAVVVHWAVDTDPTDVYVDGPGGGWNNSTYMSYSSAQLVYVLDADLPLNLSYDEYAAAIASGVVIGTASGNAIIDGNGYTAGVYERGNSDNTRTEGKYYIVLYDVLFGAISGTAISVAGLNYNDANAITFDPLNPALDAFMPEQWILPVPEPSTYALLAVGAVAVLLRRRKKS